jgi:hypothetical protein
VQIVTLWYRYPEVCFCFLQTRKRVTYLHTGELKVALVGSLWWNLSTWVQVLDLTKVLVYSWIIPGLGFNDTVLSVVGDVSVDSETPEVTTSILRFAGPTQFFGGAHKGRVCVRPFVGVSVRSCM